MKPGPGAVSIPSHEIPRAKASDFVELTKPRLTLLVLFTTFAGFCTGAEGTVPLLLLAHTLLGTALSAGGAAAFNMYSEQKIDASMRRTAFRPLVSGRVRSGQALVFALLTSFGGFAWLYFFVNPLTSLLSVIVVAGYLFLYTPLKTKTWLCTFVGAVPGALPVLMGWTAARGSLAAEAWALCAILFLWQMPHFYAIGWMHRDDYARAGLPVLSVVDASGKRTARQALAFIIILFPTSLIPRWTGMAGPAYGLGALVSGAALLWCGIRFARRRDSHTARRLFVVSALYLPALLILLVLDSLAGR